MQRVDMDTWEGTDLKPLRNDYLRIQAVHLNNQIYVYEYHADSFERYHYIIINHNHEQLIPDIETIFHRLILFSLRILPDTISIWTNGSL